MEILEVYFMKQEKKRLTPLEKIEKINQQIEKLKQQQQNVQKTFESKITSLLKKEKAYNHDFNTLYGAILDVCQKMNKLDLGHEQIKTWKTKGELSLFKKPNKKKYELDATSKKEEESVLETPKKREQLKVKYAT